MDLNQTLYSYLGTIQGSIHSAIYTMNMRKDTARKNNKVQYTQPSIHDAL